MTTRSRVCRYFEGKQAFAPIRASPLPLGDILFSVRFNLVQCAVLNVKWLSGNIFKELLLLFCAMTKQIINHLGNKILAAVILKKKKTILYCLFYLSYIVCSNLLYIYTHTLCIIFKCSFQIQINIIRYDHQ